MTEHNQTENGTDATNRTTLLYCVPTSNSSILHVKRDCQNLRKASAQIETTVAADADGTLCNMCASEQTLDELQPDVDAAATCQDCGAGIYPGTHRAWTLTPQGRRACPECAAIARDDQRDEEERLIPDGGRPSSDIERASTGIDIPDLDKKTRQTSQTETKLSQIILVCQEFWEYYDFDSGWNNCPKCGSEMHEVDLA